MLLLDDLPEPDASGRHPNLGAVLLPNEIGLGRFVPSLEHPDGLAHVPVGELELERHAAAEIVGGDQVLSVHGRSLPNPIAAHAGGGRRRTASAATRQSFSRPDAWASQPRSSHALPDRSSPPYTSRPSG